jgi:flagellar hook-length control protein FliK
LIDQVADGIAANVRQNRHEAVISLDPPELGSLKINLSLDGGKVQIHIIAEAHESKSLIENHLPELKQALQFHRLDLADVRVDSGSWNGTTGDLTHGFQRQSSGRDQSGWNSENPSHPATTTPEIQTSHGSPEPRGRISMWA